jgi:hypothetical protein
VTHDEICRNKVIFCHFFLLIINCTLNERHARQRSRTGKVDQAGRLHHVRKIDIYRVRDFLRIRFHDHHFAGMKDY